MHPIALSLLAMKAFTGIFTGKHAARYKQSEIDKHNKAVDDKKATKRAAKGK